MANAAPHSRRHACRLRALHLYTFAAAALCALPMSFPAGAPIGRAIHGAPFASYHSSGPLARPGQGGARTSGVNDGQLRDHQGAVVTARVPPAAVTTRS